MIFKTIKNLLNLTIAVFVALYSINLFAADQIRFGARSTNLEIIIIEGDFFQKYDAEFKIEIINGGIQGADSYAETSIIENKLINYSPDMVIIYDGWNDLRANNTAESVYDNWNLMCNLGKQNNFDVIIALQPIAGFGNKMLTQQESVYSVLGTIIAHLVLI